MLDMKCLIIPTKNVETHLADSYLTDRPLDRQFFLLILCSFRLIRLSHVWLGPNFFEISFVGQHNFCL